MRSFCESGSQSTGGEEVLHLPVIVEAAESSPVAAAAAAQQIRRFLSREWASKPQVQYNAIMLIRILSDNPGPLFTRNFDKTFVSTVKECLRMCKDSSTQQLLRETLDSLEANKQLQEGMEGLIQMWRKEKGYGASFGGGHVQQPPNDYMYRQPTMGIQQGQHQQHQGSQRHGSRSRQLPTQVELASRIEEARNTAKILLQLIQSTPSEEVLSSDLIREFSERCQTAQRSMQGYIACDSPPPDDDTMLTLIETNEQLSLAASRYQRSVLSARRVMGMSPPPGTEGMQNDGGAIASPTLGPLPASVQGDNLFASNRSPRQSPPTTAFGNSNETYQPPLGPPPRQSPSSGAFANNSDTYAPPLGPPPSMLARLNSRDGQSSPPPANSSYQAPRLPPVEQHSNPFADPVEHESNSAPFALEPGHYGHSTATQNHPADRPYSHTFSIDAGPTYGSRGSANPENMYSSNSGLPAQPPNSSREAWQSSGATPSYIGRQTSAANGLSMHGAGSNDNVPEIDGHSEVGRSPTHGVDRSATHETEPNSASSAYSLSPVQTRM